MMQLGMMLWRLLWELLGLRDEAGGAARLLQGGPSALREAVWVSLSGGSWGHGGDRSGTGRWR